MSLINKEDAIYLFNNAGAQIQLELVLQEIDTLTTYLGGSTSKKIINQIINRIVEGEIAEYDLKQTGKAIVDVYK